VNETDEDFEDVHVDVGDVIGNDDDKGEIVVEPLQPEISNEANDENESEEEEEEDDDDEEERNSDIKPEQQEEEEDKADDEEEADDIENKVDIEGVKIELKVEKYDEPYFASPMSSLYASLGVMLLSRRVDLFHPTIVRLVRFLFILYIVLHQCFLFYVRIQAKQNNDRTPIELKNPFSALLQNQLGGESYEGFVGNFMMKNLASSLLSSKSTVLEYDLKQARSLQSGLIFNMLFMWVLHFKMEQIQPLLIQTVNGLVSLVYNPLFQVYVLGRNLERPFKTHAFIEKDTKDSASDTAVEDSSSITIARNDKEDLHGDDDVEDDDDDEEDDSTIGPDDNLNDD
jgi:hypothetical protein